MKNIILSATLLIALSSSAFAGTKNAGPSLLKDLSSTFKKTSHVSWTNRSQYKQAVFSFNNKPASAFYSADEGDLIGYSIKFKATDLPENISSVIKNKYSDWNITDAIMFIKPSGNIDYFAEVTKDNKKIVLTINPNGRMSFYAHMP